MLLRGRQLVLRCPDYAGAVKWARVECRSYGISEIFRALIVSGDVLRPVACRKSRQTAGRQHAHSRTHPSSTDSFTSDITVSVPNNIEDGEDVQDVPLHSRKVWSVCVGFIKRSHRPPTEHAPVCPQCRLWRANRRSPCPFKCINWKSRGAAAGIGTTAVESSPVTGSRTICLGVLDGFTGDRLHLLPHLRDHRHHQRQHFATARYRLATSGQPPAVSTTCGSGFRPGPCGFESRSRLPPRGSSSGFLHRSAPSDWRYRTSGLQRESAAAGP